ncbi:MAG: sodium:proton antiporter, partial [Lachnospiraceae bacterium]|nr:sodium:proton antiporter [Lachnospiraceae bacterium]
MAFVQNFPFISILLSLFAGPISSVLNGKLAKRLNLFVITVIGGMSAAVLAFVLRTGQEYV